MRLDEFITITNGLPVIESEFLCAGLPDPASFKVQLSRWKKSGKIIQLKRGVYLLAETYRKTQLYEPYVAGVLKRPSYISLEKGLEYYSLIPEAVMVYTSVTTKRPGRFATKVGTFDFRHVKESLFWGYESVCLNNQTAFFAAPEKALLDYFYLKERNISIDYLNELRLQNVEKIDMNKLLNYAQKFESPSMLKAAKIVGEYVSLYQKDEKIL
jgi:predicted transcriptional regulator of viral defense system